MPIRVTAIQRGCVHDGPGIRTTVFLKGCFLSCPWCCNPETIHYDKDFILKKEKGIQCGISSICKTCELYCGDRKKTDCPFGVYTSTYYDYSVNELLEQIIKDKDLFINSGGGVTFSGGEPLMQAHSIKILLERLKELGIQVAFETSLYAPHTAFLEIRDFVDYWLVDVKFQFGFISYLEKDKFKYDFYKNLRSLQNEANGLVKYRMVFSHQAAGNTEEIVKRFVDAGITIVELLESHNLGNNKYKQLGKTPTQCTKPLDTDIHNLQQLFEKHGIKSQYTTL